MNALLAAGSSEVATLFVEIGAIVLGLALLARLSDRLGITPIPFYLLAGLAFGNGGIVDLRFSEEFISATAEIGVVLLLLVLGMEYTPAELSNGLKTGLPAGLVDLVANFGPGFAAGLLLGWTPPAALVLGGVTYISSSGVIAKVLGDLGRLGNRETPTILTVLVLEDLLMAAYLPILSVVLAGTGLTAGAVSLVAALGAVAAILVLAMRHGDRITALLSARSDETVLLSVLGLTLLVAGAAQWLQASAAVGAFLVGLAISGEVAERGRDLLLPLRDLFAAVFFVFFGLQIDPSTIPPVLGVAVALAVVTAATKVMTGAWAAARQGVAHAGRIRAGTALVARGEFSIVIAGLATTTGTGLPTDLGALAAAYVLLLAVGGPLLTRFSGPLAAWTARRTPRAAPAQAARARREGPSPQHEPERPADASPTPEPSG